MPDLDDKYSEFSREIGNDEPTQDKAAGAEKEPQPDFSDNADLYAVLCVSKTASSDEIKSAYRRLAKEYHPDVSGDADADEKFKKIQHAYEILFDEVQRAMYDLGGDSMAGLSYEQRLKSVFQGRIVRKDLTKKIKEGANVPVYVLEFLLGQYCSSDDPAIIETGVETVKKILSDNFVRPDEAQKDYMASGSFARGKEEKAASASMVFVGNINQSVDVVLKTSTLFEPFPPEMGTDTAFLDRIHCYLPGWEIPKFRPEHFTNSYGFISDYMAEFIRELRKVQYGDALDKYFKLGKNLNQRDTIAVRRMVDGYLKLMYPNGEFSKDELEEVLRLSLEMRRRVKEQLKKLGGMEFYDVNFSYIDNETFEEKYVSVPEQGGDTLIPEGMGAPGQVYTISRGKSGMIGAFRLESQMLPGSGKFDKTGLGSDGKAKEAANTAFNFLKANARHISGNISTTAKDYIVNYQDLQGIGMTEKLALPTVIALCSIAIGRPTLSSLAVLGDISIGGTLIKVDELANTLQACADCGAKKVLLPAVSMVDFATVPADLMTAFQLIPYQNAEDAVFKALGVE